MTCFPKPRHHRERMRRHGGRQARVVTGRGGGRMPGMTPAGHHFRDGVTARTGEGA